MRVKVGDKVRFIDDIGGGVVSKIVDKMMVKIINDDDFEVPVLAKELVVIEAAPEVTEVVEERRVHVEYPVEKEDEETFDDDEFIENDGKINVSFAFVPQDEKEPMNGDFDTYLINDCNYRIMYNILMEVKGNHKTFACGTLESNSKYQLRAVSRDEINNLSSFLFQTIVYQKGTYEPVSPMEGRIKIQPVKFYKENSFKENDFFNEDALVMPVIDNFKEAVEKITKEDVKQIIKEKQASDEHVKKISQKYKAQTDAPLVEVDLHIHEILDEFKGMSNAEILHVQMNHFHSELEKAIKDKVKKIVFIHGVGNGTLKQEVRKELGTKYKKYQFVDASFKEYGFGATMVMLGR